MIPKINVKKEGENDKFVITVGEFLVNDEEFDNRKEAEDYILTNYKLTEFEEQIICATIVKINKIQEQEKNIEK